MIRMSTLEILLGFHNSNSPDKSLGQSLKASLNLDPLSAVLLDDHYKAVDRRVGLFLKIMRECIKEADHLSDVIYSHDDLYDSGTDAVENDKAFN